MKSTIIAMIETMSSARMPKKRPSGSSRASGWESRRSIWVALSCQHGDEHERDQKKDALHERDQEKPTDVSMNDWPFTPGRR